MNRSSTVYSFGAGGDGRASRWAAVMERSGKTSVNKPHEPKKGRRSSFRFNLKTMVATTVLVASIAALFRLDWTSVVGGLGMLFALFVFAEDIWPWLPR